MSECKLCKLCTIEYPTLGTFTLARTRYRFPELPCILLLVMVRIIIFFFVLLSGCPANLRFTELFANNHEDKTFRPKLKIEVPTARQLYKQLGKFAILKLFISSKFWPQTYNLHPQFHRGPSQNWVAQGSAGSMTYGVGAAAGSSPLSLTIWSSLSASSGNSRANAFLPLTTIAYTKPKTTRKYER